MSKMNIFAWGAWLIFAGFWSVIVVVAFLGFVVMGLWGLVFGSVIAAMFMFAALLVYLVNKSMDYAIEHSVKIIKK